MLDIRHPLIEKIQTDETYVPNDVVIEKEKWIINLEQMV